MSELIDLFFFVFHGDSVVMGVVAFVVGFFSLLALPWDVIAANLKALGGFLVPWLKAGLNTALTAGVTTSVLIATGMVPGPNSQAQVAPSEVTVKDTDTKPLVSGKRVVPIAETDAVRTAVSDHASLHQVDTENVGAHRPTGPSEAEDTLSDPAQPTDAAPEIAEPNMSIAAPECPSFVGKANPLERCSMI